MSRHDRTSLALVLGAITTLACLALATRSALWLGPAVMAPFAWLAIVHLVAALDAKFAVWLRETNT